MGKYVVESGKIVKENGYWNIDGMCQKEEWEFDDIEQAKKKLSALDPRGTFRLERESGRLSFMKDEGYYTELCAMTGDDLYEVLEYKQYTYDDELLWEEHGEGWYRVGWSDAPAEEAVWCESRPYLDDQMDYISNHETDTHCGYIEWMGDDDKPEEQ